MLVLLGTMEPGRITVQENYSLFLATSYRWMEGSCSLNCDKNACKSLNSPLGSGFAMFIMATITLELIIAPKGNLLPIKQSLPKHPTPQPLVYLPLCSLCQQIALFQTFPKQEVVYYVVLLFSRVSQGSSVSRISHPFCPYGWIAFPCMVCANALVRRMLAAGQ